MIYVICTGCVCFGLVVGFVAGVKHKQRDYEVLIRQWEQRCREVNSNSHNNTMLILKQLNEFYEIMLKWKGE